MRRGDRIVTNGGSTRVLIVDDVADNREIYREVLTYEGFDVLEASDGVEAIASFVEASPDVIVMDLGLPTVDGWEATRRIRALPGGHDVRILALTGFTTRSCAERAIAAGCDAVIHKPCLPHDLAVRIDEVVRAPRPT